MAPWDAKWHTLSPQARLAYLKDVKGPQRAPSPHQKRPSVKADRFAASVLEELLAAGFVELGDSGSGGPRDRVFAVVAATDFATRVRARYRHHLLRGDLPSVLADYVRYCFYPPAAADALNSVLLHAGLQESLNLDESLRLYVVSHRWPGWVARSLKDPAAERIVELLRDANGPVRRAELEKKLPGHRRRQAASRTWFPDRSSRGLRGPRSGDFRACGWVLAVRPRKHGRGPRAP